MYAVEAESARLRSYLAGEPYDARSEPTAWYDYIQGWSDRGVVFRKVHQVRSPLTEYLRFERE